MNKEWYPNDQLDQRIPTSPGYDITLEIDLSIPEEVRNHPDVIKWVDLMSYRLSQTINAMTQRFAETGSMVVPVLYSPTLRKETKEEYSALKDPSKLKGRILGCQTKLK